MSEFSLARIIEAANKILVLFRAYINPEEFQAPLLSRQENVITLALGLIIITVVSFAAIKLIFTIRKRQRNFRELLNALDEDGPELNYNLKPLFANRTPPVKPKVSLEDNKPAPNVSDDDREFNKYIEEITSTPAHKANGANGNNKVYDLSLSNLKADKVAPDSGEQNIQPFKMADAVEEDTGNNPARHNPSISASAENKNVIGEEALQHLISAEAETVAREFSEIEAETRKDDYPPLSEQIIPEDEPVDTEGPPNTDSSILAEIESVLSGFADIESRAKAEPDEAAETVYVEEQIIPDTVMSAVESAISEFDALEAGDEEGTDSETFAPLAVREDNDAAQSPIGVEEINGGPDLNATPLRSADEKQDQPQQEAPHIRDNENFQSAEDAGYNVEEMDEAKFTLAEIDRGANAPGQDIDEISTEQNLSPELAKRIIDRLQCFQKGFDENLRSSPQKLVN